MNGRNEMLSAKNCHKMRTARVHSSISAGTSPDRFETGKSRRHVALSIRLQDTYRKKLQVIAELLRLTR